MWFFNKQSIAESGLLIGSSDYHSHILPSVDDGCKTEEDSLEMLRLLESCGVRKQWLTPHIMEDMPNRAESLKERFSRLLEMYDGGMELHLGAEYMLDSTFRKILDTETDSMLTLDGERLLVETSYYTPPIDMDNLLNDIMIAGMKPVLAHPERYRYMDIDYYDRLKQRGIIFQLDLPSVTGLYGESAKKKSEMLLKKGCYEMSGSDLHSIGAAKRFLDSRLGRKKATIINGLTKKD